MVGLVPAVVNPAVVNVPLHSTPVNIGWNNPNGNEVHEQVPSVIGRPGNITSRALPNNPITLGQWLRARGTLKISCYADGTALAELRLSNLIRHGIYTQWTIYLADRNGDGQSDAVRPFAFGGIPNVLIPDEHGRAESVRKLGYCPLTDQKLLLIDIVYHSDASTHGGAPDQPFAAFTQPMGTVTHTQIEFPMNVTPAP